MDECASFASALDTGDIPALAVKGNASERSDDWHEEKTRLRFVSVFLGKSLLFDAFDRTGQAIGK